MARTHPSHLPHPPTFTTMWWTARATWILAKVISSLPLCYFGSVSAFCLETTKQSFGRRTPLVYLSSRSCSAVLRKVDIEGKYTLGAVVMQNFSFQYRISSVMSVCRGDRSTCLSKLTSDPSRLPCWVKRSCQAAGDIPGQNTYMVKAAQKSLDAVADRCWRVYILMNFY